MALSSDLRRMLRVEAGEAVTRRPVDVENRTEGDDGPLRRVFYVGVFFFVVFFAI